MKILRDRFSWILVCCLAAVGCADSPQPKMADDPPSQHGNVVPEKAEITIPEDLSLTATEYIQAEVPASDRPWSSDEMARAYKSLSTIAKTNPTQLPRHQSEKSGEVFSRIISSDNLQFFRNRSLPIEVRLPQALAFMEAASSINKLYIAAALKKATGDSELIELLGAMLRLVAVTFELVDEFLPTLDKADPTYPARMAGVKQMKQGFATIVAGAFQTLTEKDHYRAAERRKLVEYMKETVPDLFPMLPPGTQDEMLLRLQKMSDDGQYHDLQPSLLELYKAIRDVADGSKLPQ